MVEMTALDKAQAELGSLYVQHHLAECKRKAMVEERDALTEKQAVAVVEAEAVMGAAKAVLVQNGSTSVWDYCLMYPTLEGCLEAVRTLWQAEQNLQRGQAMAEQAKNMYTATRTLDEAIAAQTETVLAKLERERGEKLAQAIALKQQQEQQHQEEMEKEKEPSAKK